MNLSTVIVFLLMAAAAVSAKKPNSPLTISRALSKLHSGRAVSGRKRKLRGVAKARLHALLTESSVNVPKPLDVPRVEADLAYLEEDEEMDELEAYEDELYANEVEVDNSEDDYGRRLGRLAHNTVTMKDGKEYPAEMVHDNSGALYYFIGPTEDGHYLLATPSNGEVIAVFGPTAFDVIESGVYTTELDSDGNTIVKDSNGNVVALLEPAFFEADFGEAGATSGGDTGVGTTTPADVRDTGDLDCDDWAVAKSGGYGTTIDTWTLLDTIPAGAAIDFRFNTYSIPDRLVVEYPPGNVVLDTGFRGDAEHAGPLYPGGIAGGGDGEELDIARVIAGRDKVKVTVFGPHSDTAWDYEVRPRCNPSGIL